MCLRNQHVDTCMPLSLLCKSTYCWNLIFHVFLFVQGRCNYGNYRWFVLFWSPPGETRQLLNSFLKGLCDRLWGMLSTVSSCTLGSLFSTWWLYWLCRCWLQAVKYRINQLHKHRLLPAKEAPKLDKQTAQWIFTLTSLRTQRHIRWRLRRDSFKCPTHKNMMFNSHLIPWFHQGWLVHIVSPQTFCCFTPLLGCYIIRTRRTILGHRRETWLSSDCSDASELQGVDISYLQLLYESDFDVLFDENAGSACTCTVCVCVSICSQRVCVLLCVFLFSMLDECEETRTRRLQRGPVLIMASPALWMLCPTALCSSTNLTSPLPLIHTQLRHLLRWSADIPLSVVHTTPLVCIVYIVTLAPDQAKLLAGSYFFSGLLFSTSDSYLVETWWGIQCGRD